MTMSKTGRTSNEQRTPWEPPTIRKVAIGAETKSAQAEDNNAALTEPQPPSSPSTKFGFRSRWPFRCLPDSTTRTSPAEANMG